MVSGLASNTAVPSRTLLLGLPFAAIVLICFFIYRGFPYDALADVIIARARAEGVAISFQQVSAKLSLAGPGVEAHGVGIDAGSGLWPVNRLLARPAWSFSWLRGQPSVYAELESPLGDIQGTLTLGEPRAWRGDLLGIDLKRFPLGGLGRAGFQGTADAELDLQFTEGATEGRVRFEAREGSVQLPGVPVPIPYERLTGELVLGGEHSIEVLVFHLQGPMLTAEIAGIVGTAANLADAPLRLEAQITADRALVGALQGAGIRMNNDGKASLRIKGTLSQPRYR